MSNGKYKEPLACISKSGFFYILGSDILMTPQWL